MDTSEKIEVDPKKYYGFVKPDPEKWIYEKKYDPK